MADREREVIVTDGGRSSGSGAIIAVVLLIALLVVLFLVFGQGLIGGDGTKDIDATIKIEPPATTN